MGKIALLQPPSRYSPVKQRRRKGATAAPCAGEPGRGGGQEEVKERERVTRRSDFHLSIRVVVAWRGGAKVEGGDRL